MPCLPTMFLLRLALVLLLPLLGEVGARAEQTAAEQKPVRIGILVYRGTEEGAASWRDLPGRLEKAIPGTRFELSLLAGPELRDAVWKRNVDFVLTNSSQYVSLAAEFGIKRIATLTLPDALSSEEALGSVVLVRAGQNELAELGDLRGRRIAAVAPDAFGGYLAAAREFHGAGVDLEGGDVKMSFVGFPMMRAVEALSSGAADAAIVRTCFLEQLAAKGMLKPTDFKVVARKRLEGFPCATSTRLYPDWPMAVVRGVDPTLEKAVAVALLSLAPSPTGISWSVPADYQPVFDLYRELMIGPYSDMRTSTVRGLFKTYRPYFIAFGLLLVGWLIHVFRVESLVQKRTAELKKAQARAIELQREAEHMARLSILGEMSSTLAHELNQPLTTIATYAQGVERRSAAGEVAMNLVLEANREILAQTHRATEVIRRVRSFARKPVAAREVKPLGDTVSEAIGLLGSLLPDHPAISLRDELPLGGEVEADHLQLQQVMLNLLRNASDAMAGMPKRERAITVTLERRGREFVVSVADRGPAVPPETLEKLFQPFFSTKSDGLGLGLAICKSIIEAHGGHLRAEARHPPPGLVFSFNLPDGGTNG